MTDPLKPNSSALLSQVQLLQPTHPAQFQAATFKGDLDDNLAHIAGLGYDGVELAIRDPSLVDGDMLASAIERHGLEVPAIGTGQAWGEERLSFTDADTAIRAAALDRLKSHLPLAARMNSIVIVGLIRGVFRSEVPREQTKAWLIEGLRECARAAGPMGVRLVLEPLNRYETSLINTVGEALDVIERVGEENLGLLPDTFHMNIEEGSIEDSLRRAADRIIHFHVADSNRWYPGAGHLDFPRILGLLRELGYTGYVSGEFLAQPDALTAARRAISYLQEVLPPNRGT